MYCQKCGEENLDDAAFCEKCGTSLKKDTAPLKTSSTIPDENKTRKITLGFIVGWVFGIFFALGGLSFLIQGAFGAGIPLIIASFILIPPVINWIESKINIKLSRGLKIVLVIILFVAYGVNIPDDMMNQPSTFDNTNAASKEVTQPKYYSIGDRVVVKDIAYTVNSAHTQSSVGSQNFGNTADGIFVIVDLTIENVGTESKDISSSFFKILDSNNRVFESDNEAWVYLDDNILFKQIQPGLPTKGQAIFDVPKNTNVFLQVSGSIWDTETVVISLVNV